MHVDTHVGATVHCPADRGDPAYLGKVTHVGTQPCYHPMVEGPYFWVEVKHPNSRRKSVWPSNRLGLKIVE